MANIREVDAIVHVVRAFDDENVMREQGRESSFVDPMADIETINLELILADLESINKRYTRVEKLLERKRQRFSSWVSCFAKIKPVLENGLSLVLLNLMRKNKRLSKIIFIDYKPVLYVANVGVKTR